MSREELQGLRAAIDKGSNAEFGLVKLSPLQLDAPLQSPADAPWPMPAMTLLEYAAWRGRDAIAGALLRAGADAAARHRSCPKADQQLPSSELGPAQQQAPDAAQILAPEAAPQPASSGACSEAARACLSRTLPMHAVWIVRQLVLMRIAAVQRVVQQQLVQPSVHQAVHQAVQRTDEDQVPVASMEGGQYNDVEGGRCDGVMADGQYGLRCRICQQYAQLPVAFLSCGHICCELCVWLMLKEGVGGGADLQCPCVAAEREAGGRGSVGGEESREAEGERGARADEAARRRKQESWERWRQLPDAPTPSRQLRSTALEKPKFSARTAAEVARLYVGATRAQRQSNLWKAAEAGNVERLRALVEAGVDVDGVNEYGQTALYLAALHGHEEAVRQLCAWAGADVEVRVNGGGSCLTAAAGNGHSRVVGVLVEASGAEGRTAEAVARALRELGVEEGGREGCEACEGCAGSRGLVGDGIQGGGSGPVDQGQGLAGSCCSCSCCPRVECLIPEALSHPGAGSYSIDDALTGREMQRLLELWACLLQQVEGGGTGAGAGADGRGQGEGCRTKSESEGLKQGPASDCTAGSTTASGGGGSTVVPLPPAGPPASSAAGDGTAAAAAAAAGGVERVYYYDAEGWVRRLIWRAVRRARLSGQMQSEVAGQALPGMRFLVYRSEGASMAPHVDLAKQVPGGQEGGGAAGAARRRMSTHTFLLYLGSCGAGGGATLLLEREGPSVEASGGVLAAVRPRAGRLLLFPHKCPHAGAPVAGDCVQLPKLLIRGELY